MYGDHADAKAKRHQITVKTAQPMSQRLAAAAA
jgi:hypothetical protein